MLKNIPVLFLDQKLMINNPELERSLFLCTTPLQARICLEIIAITEINNFDFIYFTRHQTDTDIAYFKKIKSIANNSIILYIKNNKNLISKIFSLQRPFNNKDNYNNIYLASIDNLLFRNILKKNNNSNIYTFDDGTANIFNNSSYFSNKDSKKSAIFSKIFNLPSKSDILKKSKKHYTIFRNFDNILPQKKLEFITIFDKNENSKTENEKKIFFIGQPFEEYLNNQKIIQLKKYLEKINIDYYVKHPREKKPIIKNINILDKKNDIAEIAILKEAGQNKPLIISAFSTVLFNIDEKMADKIYLSLMSDEQEKNRLELVKKTGAKIIKLSIDS